MQNCIGCIYESDKNKLLVKQYIGWASTQPHPCLICRRFPREPVSYPDHFETSSDIQL